MSQSGDEVYTVARDGGVFVWEWIADKKALLLPPPEGGGGGEGGGVVGAGEGQGRRSDEQLSDMDASEDEGGEGSDSEKKSEEGDDSEDGSEEDSDDDGGLASLGTVREWGLSRAGA